MRIHYLIAEIVVLWVVITALGLLFILLWRGFDDLGQLMAFCFVFVAFAGSIKLATIGDRRSIATGVYRPIRLLSLILVMWRLLRLCVRLLHHMSMTQANMAAPAVGTLALAVTDATRTKWLPRPPVCHTLSPGGVGLAEQYSMCSTSSSSTLHL